MQVKQQDSISSGDNDMYLPVATIDIVREDQIQELYEKALNYCHPIQKGWEKVRGVTTIGKGVKPLHLNSKVLKGEKICTIYK